MDKNKWKDYMMRFVYLNEQNPNLPQEEDFSNLINELESDTVGDIYQFLHDSYYNPFMDMLSKMDYGEYKDIVLPRIDFMKKNFNYTMDFFLKNGIWGNVSYKRKDFCRENYIHDIIITFNYNRLEIYYTETKEDTFKHLGKFLAMQDELEVEIDKPSYILCKYNEKTDIFNIIEALKIHLEDL